MRFVLFAFLMITGISAGLPQRDKATPDERSRWTEVRQLVGLWQVAGRSQYEEWKETNGILYGEGYKIKDGMRETFEGRDTLTVSVAGRDGNGFIITMINQ